MNATTLSSPLGPIAIGWNERTGKINGIDFAASSAPEQPRCALPPAVQTLIAQLRDYFHGHMVSFSWESLDLGPCTDFRRRVYAHIFAIPPGTTQTYAEVAAAVGSPGAARAVGGAMAANRLPIVVPCHRVVAAKGLGGYTGGLDKKRQLLALEAGD